MTDSDRTGHSLSYEPLAANHVRLIALWGIPLNGWPREINCRFEVHHIDDLASLEYDAISYAWDNASAASESVNCYHGPQHGTIQVTEHLWHGLASVMRKGPSILCWIDALCINQNDIVEKQHQIPLMAQIYSLSKNVIVWLGDVPLEDQEIVNMETILMVTAMLQMSEPGFSLPIALMLDPTCRAFGEAIKRLELNPWFRRSWVCQEVILGQNPLVLYGRNVIPWDLIHELSHASQLTNFDMFKLEIQDNDPSSIAERYNSLSAIQELRSAHRRTTRSIETSRIIDLIRNTSATNLSDKVYCVLGLLDPDIAGQIVVDYDKHYTQVYLEFAAAVVQHDKTLSLLANTTLSVSSQSSLPSWCPDLSRGAPDVFSFLDFEYFAGFEDVDQQTNRVKLLPGGRSISVPGFRLGVVKEVAALRPDVGVPSNEMVQRAMTDTASEILPWMDSVQGMIRRAMEPHGYTEAEIYDASWRVHIASAANAYLTPDPENTGGFQVDYLQAFYPACDLLGKGYKIFVQLMRDVDFKKLMSGDLETILSFDKFTKDSGIGPGEMQLYEAWVTEFRAFARRKIFVCENGLVGIGPAGIRPGDVACVLFDCSPAIVLRPRQNGEDSHGQESFVSVGDAYIYGCMELSKTSSHLKEKIEDFIIA